MEFSCITNENQISESSSIGDFTNCKSLEIQSDESKEASLVYFNSHGPFVCEKCSKEFAHKRNLLSHVKTIHEGASYKCTHCDYNATQKSNLKKHIEAIHEGVRHPYSLCSYRATEKGSLKMHVKSMHQKRISPVKVTNKCLD